MQNTNDSHTHRSGYWRYSLQVHVSRKICIDVTVVNYLLLGVISMVQWLLLYNQMLRFAYSCGWLAAIIIIGRNDYSHHCIDACFSQIIALDLIRQTKLVVYELNEGSVDIKVPFDSCVFSFRTHQTLNFVRTIDESGMLYQHFLSESEVADFIVQRLDNILQCVHLSRSCLTVSSEFFWND